MRSILRLPRKRAVRRRGGRPIFPKAAVIPTSPVLDRTGMRVGETVEGPALIEETDSTTILLPGDRAAISPRGHLVIDIGGTGDD